MNSRVMSKVNLTTANSPLVRVHSHRFIETSEGEQRIRSDALSVTNKFLRSGGSLPSVLPAVGWDELDYQNSLDKAGKQRSRQTSITKEKFRFRSEVKLVKSSKTQRETNPKNSPDKLEKRMEQLSCELSKVQSVLQIHQKNVVESSKKADELGGSETFSANDYTCLILEMNGKLPGQQYDPSEFSVEDHQRRLENQCSDNRNSETLLALQEEIRKWRAEQKQSKT